MRYWIDRYATSILAVSEGAMASSWGPKWVTDPRCQVIYNGLDLSAFEKPLDLRGVLGEFKLPEDSHLYIHVGSMSPAKNHLRLISIFSTILRHEPMARLILVGRGNNGIEQRVRSWVEELGISDQVVFAGERHDVPRLLKAADMMLFPSLREGLPGVVLEACAAGTPVLASDLPGVREIAAHLPLVHYLSLNASDEEWALEACRIFGSYVRDIDKEMGIRNFADSVFGMTRCVEAQCSIWQTGRTGLEA